MSRKYQSPMFAAGCMRIAPADSYGRVVLQKIERRPLLREIGGFLGQDKRRAPIGQLVDDVLAL